MPAANGLGPLPQTGPMAKSSAALVVGCHASYRTKVFPGEFKQVRTATIAAPALTGSPIIGSPATDVAVARSHEPPIRRPSQQNKRPDRALSSTLAMRRCHSSTFCPTNRECRLSRTPHDAHAAAPHGSICKILFRCHEGTTSVTMKLRSIRRTRSRYGACGSHCDRLQYRLLSAAVAHASPWRREPIAFAPQPPVPR